MPTKQQRSKRRAAKAGLRYVNEFEEGISRQRCGTGFSYKSATGRTISSGQKRDRLVALAIPPAWSEVWICPNAKGHIQARGVDDAGRTQYIYHPQWKAASAARKFDRMHLFAEVLPRVRRRLRKDLNGKRLRKPRVLAAVIRLLDRGHLRVGNTQSVAERDARGATTLDEEHVSLDGVRISLDFPGKSGQRREIEFSDRKVAKVISQCEEVDGQYLFCYVNGSGKEYSVDSTSVNSYLKDVSPEAITAKDFRTWWGSVTALSELADMPSELTASDRKKRCIAAVKSTADALGNTVAVCRSSYVGRGPSVCSRTAGTGILLEVYSHQMSWCLRSSLG